MASEDPRELVRTEALTYEIGGKAILDSVSLSIRGGEFVGVIGPNGAGKTTLLRLVLGIIAPTSGRVLLSGEEVGSMKPRRRAMTASFMSQDPGSVFPFPVMDVVLMGRYPYLKATDRESDEDREKAVRMLAYVGLPGFEERSFTELSGGERQLVLFAKTLVQETGVILLDEPSSNLDIGHEDRIFSIGAEMADEGRAVVTCVHNLNVAARYCSRLVLLDRGKVVADGTPRRVLDPAVLDPVYDVKTAVTANLASGTLTVTAGAGRKEAVGPRVHVIGGAGSAVIVTRELYRAGYRITAGIAHDRDSDHDLWDALGIPSRTVGAFSVITDSDVEEAAKMVEEAELTVLCLFPVGAGNAGNLALARRARRLVVLLPEPGEKDRQFFDPEAELLFLELIGRAEMMTYTEFVDNLLYENRR